MENQRGQEQTQSPETGPYKKTIESFLETAPNSCIRGKGGGIFIKGVIPEGERGREKNRFFVITPDQIGTFAHPNNPNLGVFPGGVSFSIEEGGYPHRGKPILKVLIGGPRGMGETYQYWAQHIEWVDADQAEKLGLKEAANMAKETGQEPLFGYQTENSEGQSAYIASQLKEFFPETADKVREIMALDYYPAGGPNPEQGPFYPTERNDIMDSLVEELQEKYGKFPIYKDRDGEIIRIRLTGNGGWTQEGKPPMHVFLVKSLVKEGAEIRRGGLYLTEPYDIAEIETVQIRESNHVLWEEQFQVRDSGRVLSALKGGARYISGMRGYGQADPDTVDAFIADLPNILKAHSEPSQEEAPPKKINSDPEKLAKLLL